MNPNPPSETFWEKIIRSCYVRLLGKYPDRAIRFPRLVNLDAAKVTDQTAPEVESVRQRFGLTDLYLAHGTAFQEGNNTYLITGPPGTGKTHFLNGRRETNGATPLEDGIVLLGRNAEGKIVLIETGAYPTALGKSRIDQWLRKVTGFSSAYLGKKSDAERKPLKRKEVWIARAGLVLSALFLPKDRSSFRPRALPLERWIFLHDPNDRMWTRHIPPGNVVKRIQQREQYEREFGPAVDILDSASFEHPREWQAHVGSLLERPRPR